MQLYLAPLQGLTDWIFREAFSEHIGRFDKTFTPFVRMQQGEFYRPSQCNDLLPTNNSFQKPVPQFLGNDVLSFKKFEAFCLENNYKEVNINMGCPYPMVTGKRMGAGLLANPTLVASLLEGAFTNTSLKISVKCRLGLDDATQFSEIVSIFNSFPLEELIIHPRIGKQQYKGTPDRQNFAHYAPLLKHSVCYNGDINSLNDLTEIQQLHPTLNKVMIGRGVVQNPFLLHELRNETLSSSDKVKMLRNFHLSMIAHCKTKYASDQHFLKRMEELWEYHHKLYDNGHKVYKQVRKSRTLAQYEEAVFKAINSF